MKGGSSSIVSIIGDIRTFLIAGQQNFPLAIAGTLLIIGLMSANYAMLFLLIGFLFLTPILATLVNMGLDFLNSFLPESIAALTRIQKNDLCDLVIKFPSSATTITSTGAVSLWLAMTTFLMAYLLTNAIAMLNYKTEYPANATDEIKSEIDDKVKSRTTQAIIAISMIVIIFLAMALGRLRSGCETIAGIIITIGIFGYFGYQWYDSLASVGNNRLADIFGIANRLLSPNAVGNAPVGCLPMNA